MSRLGHTDVAAVPQATQHTLPWQTATCLHPAPSVMRMLRRLPWCDCPRFSVPEEIVEIDAFHAATSHECGKPRRAVVRSRALLCGPQRLSTDRRFNARFPGLLARTARRAGSGQDALRRISVRGGVVPRVVEYHTVTPGGL